MPDQLFHGNHLIDLMEGDWAPGQAKAIQDTPRRWWKAVREMTEGYRVDIRALLSTQFDDVPHGDLIVLREVPFVSLCEHHLMPFSGHATVGYIPNPDRGVVGLSKLARLVEAHARRLQVQERLTHDVAVDLLGYTEAQGAGCVVTAQHSCMSCRGVRKTADMVTSSLHGVFRDGTVRHEFLALTQGGR